MYTIEALEKLEKEFEDNSVGFDDIKSQLRLKLEQSALTPLWKHFDRFSLYDDLKGLHNKLMPEIKKIETR